jgi:DNA-binding transcriptional regulator YdaS (Cro superfamily)
MGKINTRPNPTAQSAAISGALRKLGKGAGARLAASVGAAPAFVSQWATARRPVPPELAPGVAEFLGLRPEQVSAAYARIPARGEPAPEALPPAVARTPNDVRAINLALGALVVAMTKHRPTEAVDVAAAIRRIAPTEFREHGLLKELLTTLDAASAARKQRAE